MFKCEKCNRKFKKNCNLARHVNTTCSNNENNKNTDNKCNKCGKEFNNIYNLRRHIKLYCKVTKLETNENITQKEAIIKQNEINDKINKNICNYCDKIFNSKSSLCRHINHNCKVYKAQNKEKENIYNELKRLREENKVIKKEFEEYKKNNNKNVIMNNTTNNNTTNNNTINNTTNNNLIMFSFGKEDISKIQSSEILKALKMGFHSTLKLTDTIHFNPKYPEYHNVYIPSMKDKYAMIYKNDNWQLVNKQDLVDEMYDNKKDYIEENVEEFCNTLSNSQKNAINRWLLSDEHNDKRISKIKDIYQWQQKRINNFMPLFLVYLGYDKS